MTRLTPLTPDQLDDAQRQLYDAIVSGPRASPTLTNEQGSLRGPFDSLLRIPGIGAAVQEVGARVRYSGSLPDDVRELVTLTTASYWGCAYEHAAHGRLAVAAGVDPEVVEALAAGRVPVLVEGSTLRLAHDAAVELLTSHGLASATFGALTSSLGEAPAVELIIVVGYYSLLAMLLEGLEVRP
jgi:4-carboxymuconolactone decarboxylase